MVQRIQGLSLRHQDAKMIEKFRFCNFRIFKSLFAKSTIGNPKIMVLRTQELPSRHPDANIIEKSDFISIRNNQRALSQIENEELKNNGAETSNPTLESPGCKN